VAVCLLAPLALGCGGVGEAGLVPVRGCVTVDGRPLHAEKATVVFKPDKGRGNLTDYEPVGSIDKDGNYTLVTAGKNGAPRGWYKVLVAAFEAPKDAKRFPGKPAKGYRLLVNRRYADPNTSALKIKVVADAPSGHYDLKLTN
jgi:hypothetical protein